MYQVKSLKRSNRQIGLGLSMLPLIEGKVAFGRRDILISWRGIKTGGMMIMKCPWSNQQKSLQKMRMYLYTKVLLNLYFS